LTAGIDGARSLVGRQTEGGETGRLESNHSSPTDYLSFTWVVCLCWLQERESSSPASNLKKAVNGG